MSPFGYGMGICNPFVGMFRLSMFNMFGFGFFNRGFWGGFYNPMRYSFFGNSSYSNLFSSRRTSSNQFQGNSYGYREPQRTSYNYSSAGSVFGNGYSSSAAYSYSPSSAASSASSGRYSYGAGASSSTDNSAVYSYHAPAALSAGNSSSGRYGTSPYTLSPSAMGDFFLNNAYKYYGYNEADGSADRFVDGNTNSRRTPWCAAFVTYVVKETYRAQGKQVPAGFGSYGSQTMKRWAIQNNKYMSLSGMCNSERARYIYQNVKPGDIFIYTKTENSGHTGFVTKVYPDGSFDTIEGNYSDKVQKVHHRKPTDVCCDAGVLNGFIRLS